VSVGVTARWTTATERKRCDCCEVQRAVGNPSFRLRQGSGSVCRSTARFRSDPAWYEPVAGHINYLLLECSSIWSIKPNWSVSLLHSLAATVF
jgi:hypothetical protein